MLLLLAIEFVSILKKKIQIQIQIIVFCFCVFTSDFSTFSFARSISNYKILKKQSVLNNSLSKRDFFFTVNALHSLSNLAHFSSANLSFFFVNKKKRKITF
jgi:hypothetical protein